MLFVFLCLISLSTIRPVISNIPDSISKLRPSSGTSTQSLGADCGRGLLGHRIGSQRSASIPGLRGSCVGLLPLPCPSSFAPWISPTFLPWWAGPAPSLGWLPLLPCSWSSSGPSPGAGLQSLGPSWGSHLPHVSLLGSCPVHRAWAFLCREAFPAQRVQKQAWLLSRPVLVAEHREGPS